MTITASNVNRPVTKIYESPDGGKTIYVREAGSELKTLLTRDPQHIGLEKAAMRANRLLSILKLSETDTTLKDALEALEALYILKYNDDKND
jgi:hypothetical protein